MKLSIKLALFFTFMFFMVSINGPIVRAFEDKPSEASDTANPQDKSGFNLGAAIVSIFKDHISAVDGDRCPSVPTCSAYGVEAFKKHGFLQFIFRHGLDIDFEGQEETTVSPLVYSDGKWKIYDPVKNNDFWWYPPEKKPPQ